MNDPTNLAIRLGIKLPESIVAKIVMMSDGSEAWGLSDSGLIHLPLGHLYDYPILMPETTQVFLAMDDCNRGVASGTLKVNNLGKGRLTYTVAASSERGAGLQADAAAWRHRPSPSRWSPDAAAWCGSREPISGRARARSRARR